MSIGGTFSLPSIGDSGVNLPQLYPAPADIDDFLLAKDPLLNNDPILRRDQDNLPQDPPKIEADNLGKISDTSRPVPADSHVRVQSIGPKEETTDIRLAVLSELKRFAVQAVQPNANEPPQSDWDARVSGPDDGAKPVLRGGSLLARGPPEITVVKNAADVQRAIPDTSHLRQFREQLQEKFWRKEIESVRVYSYLGATGGRITTVDVSHAPALVEILPRLYPHERRLIEKLIASGARQIQVALIEGDIVSESTPDLVLDGRMAEMKSILSSQIESALPGVIRHANAQIYKHARRHGLGFGTAVIDLTQEDYVPVDVVLGLIRNWRTIAEREEVPSAIDKIEVFSRHDYKFFTRKADGSFELEESSNHW